jgi:DNA polymerase III delta subunit
MRHIFSATFVLILFFASPVRAETAHIHGPGGHSHGPATSEFVIQKAGEKVKSLVENGKLEASWGDYKVVSAAKREMATGTEWVVTLKNEKSKDLDKQTLHLFFTSYGSYIATNFTGQ